MLSMKETEHQTSSNVSDILNDIESRSGDGAGGYTNGFTTRHEQIDVRDKRREVRLKKMKERQFDRPTLHQLFRVFDSTNSHLLSLSDFQTGLLAMGFKEAEG